MSAREKLPAPPKLLDETAADEWKALGRYLWSSSVMNPERQALFCEFCLVGSRLQRVQQQQWTVGDTPELALAAREYFGRRRQLARQLGLDKGHQ